MSDDKAEENIESAQELTQFVKGVLNQMNDRFTTMTDSVITRIEEMTERINDLEQTVVQLVEETNSLEPKSQNNISENNYSSYGNSKQTYKNDDEKSKSYQSNNNKNKDSEN